MIREIPVEYTAVDEQVPLLWNEVKPKVTMKIHIKIRNKSLHMNEVLHLICTYLWFLWHEVTMGISTPSQWDASPSEV